MRSYSNKITLLQNGRGVFSLDPSVGCTSGTKNSKHGCYNECYAAKSAKIYGYDFTKTVYRDFDDESHIKSIVREIYRINMPFIRMGTSGDPSENWEHTISIIRQLALINKPIVIITKHWNAMTEEQILEMSQFDIVFNSSVSALDDAEQLQSVLKSHSKISKRFKSYLRVVTADFNTVSDTGLRLSLLQEKLLREANVIDTVLRISKGNALAKGGVINAKKSKFLGGNSLISKHNKKTYMGKCGTCKELCGVGIAIENKT